MPVMLLVVICCWRQWQWPHDGRLLVALVCEDEGQLLRFKASCRRNFSLDVILLDALGQPVNKEIEVDASLLYADNGEPVEKPNDSEAPLLTSYDGIEFSSSDRPSKLSNGRASFKLKISQSLVPIKRIGVNRSWLSEDTKIKVGVVNAFCSRFSEEGDWRPSISGMVFSC
ncbi:SH2 domain-containing protein B [Vitis vinifera]|uniref:SH2 domain-containing protein B n=1 Tax=Vitis vinifera TaxID=29760 RepID=A0A438HBX4_VITVI|nr:SH2 domain-containing protein B [Vitis vinifera]